MKGKKPHVVHRMPRDLQSSKPSPEHQLQKQVEEDVLYATEHSEMPAMCRAQCLGAPVLKDLGL